MNNITKETRKNQSSTPNRVPNSSQNVIWLRWQMSVSCSMADISTCKINKMNKLKKKNTTNTTTRSRIATKYTRDIRWVLTIASANPRRELPTSATPPPLSVPLPGPSPARRWRETPQEMRGSRHTRAWHTRGRRIPTQRVTHALIGCINSRLIVENRGRHVGRGRPEGEIIQKLRTKMKNK